VATIITEEMAPEISPKVSMVFFISVSCQCKRKCASTIPD
jgi:hypothetical protein